MKEKESAPPKMALLQHEKFAQRHPRPAFQSQHSNSVPSTPYQQPRDLRFHSRSPSPHRGLSNQSPRSVASEAVGTGQNGSLRGAPAAPVVCKFETGPEFRKRRIPYVDGGEKELGPPKKELKKTLEPDEQSKLSGDMRELYDRLLPSDESEERRVGLVKKLERIMNEEWPGNDIKVSVFGSSGNLLSSSDSDVDICVTTSMAKLESMHSLAMLLHKNGMEKVVCRAAAKVPIVKCWDPELQLACDINVNNPLALENTRMIKTYVQLDDRVRPLAKIIKHWTKQRLLNDAAFGGTISSYTWICMVISFLQRRDPPILPSLQKMHGKRSTINGKESDFADDLDSLRGWGDANKETLPDLLFYFFLHYGYEFEYSNYVVSVKEGRLLSRKEKGWDNPADKEARCRLCVEEPFNTPRNLGNSADDYAWHGIHTEIRRAYEFLADGGRLDQACEQFEFPPEPEKVLFQRPPPKPKPTLTRSASQSGGRPNHEPGTGRRKGGNRNQSAQRAGNRRASSGASYSAQRGTFLQSPPVGTNSADYFQAKGNLHDQLYQQYQYLQAQQDALRSQLVAQQQSQHAQAQAQARAGDLAGVGSPHHRTQLANGSLASPRYINDAPQTAPLLQQYVWGYPRSFPHPQGAMPPPGQRTREGTNTNPSSPSLVAAVPALRRQTQRQSMPEGANGSIRSQSQPGRSIPHPALLQQHVQNGGSLYDVGAPGGPYQNVRLSQVYAQGQPGTHVQYSPMAHMQPVPNGTDTAMPKEYVGYYVGQSPSLGPQYANAAQMQIPSIPALRDPPQRQRRVTPDLMPPIANGRHASRSPSPLGDHLRSYSTTSDLRASHSHSVMMQSPTTYEPPTSAAAAASAPATELDLGGPIIVNGSNPPSLPKPAERVNGMHSGSLPARLETAKDADLARAYSLPLRQMDTNLPDLDTNIDRYAASPRISPSPRSRMAPRLDLSPNGQTAGTNGSTGAYEPAPVSAALLSPVAELRTPSPTHPQSFTKQDSPQKNGFVKAAQIANAKQVQREENDKPATKQESKHERKTSNAPPVPQGRSVQKSPTQPTPVSATQDKNPWQQATGRKGHKKSKSTAGGQVKPANESERKGG